MFSILYLPNVMNLRCKNILTQHEITAECLVPLGVELKL